MVKYRIEKSIPFRNDLKGILIYGLTHGGSKKELTKLSKRIDESIRALESSPMLGMMPKDRNLLRDDYRVLIIDKYLIFYRINNWTKTIEVNRIFNSKTDYIKIIK